MPVFHHAQAAREGAIAAPTDPAPGRVRQLSIEETHRLAEVGVLSASLVHELRQPLFAARALAQLAHAAVRPEQVQGHLDGVLAQLHTLELLLRGYAEIGRSPAGNAVAFDVWTAVHAALAILERKARSAGVTVTLGGVEAAHVMAPVLAVQQVVVNLGQNAIDALAGREGAELRITVLVNPVRLRVEDNGPGVDTEIRSRLFEPFRTTKEGGTGLGLMLSRDLAEGFGGALVLIDAEAGAGTAWEVTIPT